MLVAQNLRVVVEVPIDLTQILAEARMGLIWGIEGDLGRTPNEVKFKFLRTMDHANEFHGYLNRPDDYLEQVEEIREAIAFATPIVVHAFRCHLGETG